MGLIFVVARDQVARFESLRASLVGAEDILIMMDRRKEQHRTTERREADRRRTDVDASLRAIGWALVEQAS